MNKVVAIIVDGIASTDILTSVCRLDPAEIVLFGNGVDVEDKYRAYRNLLGDACPDKVTYMQVESENKIPMDRVYRQILSYVHQTYLEGQLLIFYGSDKVINPDTFKLINRYGVIPHMNALPEYTNFDISRPIDLFYLKSPVAFSLSLDISDIKNALTSRDLIQFLRYFTKLGRIRPQECGVGGNLADWSIRESFIGLDLVDTHGCKDNIINLVNFIKINK